MSDLILISDCFKCSDQSESRDKMKASLRLRFKLSANEDVNNLEASSNISSIGSVKSKFGFQINAKSPPPIIDSQIAVM